jgi:pimeloyl-ACP methyl ester carboxylesterase
MAKGLISSGLERVYPSKVPPATPRAARHAPGDYGVTAEPDWRATEWSEHLRTIRLAGRSVTYVEMGSGEGSPVVLVHGLGANWQNWLETLPALARERRTIALDLPGFGESEMPADRRPTVTAARATTAAGFFRVTQRRDFVVRPRLRHLALAPVVRHPTLIAPDLVHEVMKALGKPGYLDALDAVLLYDFRDRLEEISCPALLLWGEKDMLVPVADADEFERRIPDARKVLLEDTGHAPQLERATEFNRELLAFLAEGTGQGGRIDARSLSAEASSNGAGPERSGVRAA